MNLWACCVLFVVGGFGEFTAFVLWVQESLLRWRLLVILCGLAAVVGGVGLIINVVQLMSRTLQILG